MLTTRKLTIRHQNLDLSIAYFDRPGREIGPTLLYLHGLGCRKYDFLSACDDARLKACRLVAFDYPGCGESLYPANVHYAIGDITAIMDALIGQLNLQPVVLIGHSVGGMVGTHYAHHQPDRVSGLVCVVPNMTANDCFWTRDVSLGKRTRESSIGEFVTRQDAGSQSYVGALKQASSQAYKDYSTSIVNESDSGGLFEEFCELEVPKLFVYCEDSKDSIDYLDAMEDRGVRMVCVPNSFHWPTHDNPKFFYGTLADFVKTLPSHRP